MEEKIMALIIQTWGLGRCQSLKWLPHKPENLGSSLRIHMKNQAWWLALVITALGRQRQEDPWCLLVNQPNLKTMSPRSQ